METENGYMTLKRKTRFKTEQRSKDFSWSLHCYSIVLMCGCFGILIVMVTLIGLIFQSLSNVSFVLTKGKNMNFYQTGNTNSLREKNFSCPNTWLLNQKKCYWFLTSPKTWNKSQYDCINLYSHLLVIQTWSELEFIQKNVKPGQPAWIGLHISAVQGNRWMWINEHPFVEQNSFPIIGPTDNVSCAVITGRQMVPRQDSRMFIWWKYKLSRYEYQIQSQRQQNRNPISNKLYKGEQLH